MSTGTIFTAGGSLLRDSGGGAIPNPGNQVPIEINVGLLGVALVITGTYSGSLAVEITANQGGTWTQIDTITSQQVTKVYPFPQNLPFLWTDFRVRGLAWVSGTANIAIIPWTPPVNTTFAGSAGIQQVQHAPDIFRSVQVTAAGNTAIWTPAAGKKFRLLGFWLRPTDDANLATLAQNLTVSFQDGTTPLSLAFPFYVLKPPETFTPVQLDLGPLGYLSSAVGNVLNVNLNLAITAGWCRVNVWGTEE